MRPLDRLCAIASIKIVVCSCGRRFRKPASLWRHFQEVAWYEGHSGSMPHGLVTAPEKPE